MEEVEDALERDFPRRVVVVKLNTTVLVVWRGKWKERGMQMELGNMEDDVPLPLYRARSEGGIGGV